MLDIAYSSTKSALLSLLAERSPAEWEQRVPATTDWRVRELVQERDTFAQHQVTVRGDRGPEELAAEWAEAHLPALALRSNGKDRVLGGGPPAATLTADRWELLRALAGRRSREQIESMQWTGDPRPYLPLIPAYGERADPLIEG